MHSSFERRGGRLTLMLLVDALRFDYVERTRYLRELSKGALTGRLREPFGFVPRAAYFGGLRPDEYGFTNMYRFDPDRSPFGIASSLPRPRTEAAERLSGVREKVEAHARERVAPFARQYLSTLRVPLELAPLFDAVETRAPWEAAAGYRSLFHLLDERGLRWYECSWPGTNLLEDGSDRGIVERTLADIAPDHRFTYVHLQELDGVGHVSGPGSRELVQTIARTDALVERLVEGLRARFEEVDVLLFGDHGMVNVVRTYDLWGEVERTGLSAGVDYVYFIDSSMARFWFFTDAARRRVRDVLSESPLGTVLDENTLRRYRMSQCDPRNGELFFLAHPGVLIFPNFYQTEGDPIEGMHGYAPDCPDNEGYFLLASSKRALPGGDIGVVEAHELFPTLVDLLELDEATTTPASALGREAGPMGTRFTSHPDPEADVFLARSLEAVADAIESAFGNVRALVLAGSFGRGEGGVVRHGERFKPVNDIDLVVVAPSKEKSAERLAGRLARELGCDFVDIAIASGDWDRLPPTIFNYELKYGAQVLRGDRSVLDAVPSYAPADIPLFEGVQLLLNRTAGLLTGVGGGSVERGRPEGEARRYLTRQVVKALMAIGDWHLLSSEAYDWSYARRRARFQNLFRALGIEETPAARIDRAYAFKLLPDYRAWPDPVTELHVLWPTLESTIVAAIGRMTESTARDLDEALDLFEEHLLLDVSRAADDVQRLRERSELSSMLRPEPLATSVRAAVYGALPLLLAGSVDGSTTGLEKARARLLRAFRLPDGDGASWEATRRTALSLWEVLSH